MKRLTVFLCLVALWGCSSDRYKAPITAKPPVGEKTQTEEKQEAEKEKNEEKSGNEREDLLDKLESIVSFEGQERLKEEIKTETKETFDSVGLNFKLIENFSHPHAKEFIVESHLEKIVLYRIQEDLLRAARKINSNIEEINIKVIESEKPNGNLRLESYKFFDSEERSTDLEVVNLELENSSTKAFAELIAQIALGEAIHPTGDEDVQEKQAELVETRKKNKDYIITKMLTEILGKKAIKRSSKFNREKLKKMRDLGSHELSEKERIEMESPKYFDEMVEAYTEKSIASAIIQISNMFRSDLQGLNLKFEHGLSWTWDTDFTIEELSTYSGETPILDIPVMEIDNTVKELTNYIAAPRP